MAHRGEKSLLAATVLIGCCFLALLGVITTVYMLQQQHKTLANLQALSTARQEPGHSAEARLQVGPQQVHPPQALLRARAMDDEELAAPPRATVAHTTSTLALPQVPRQQPSESLLPRV